MSRNPGSTSHLAVGLRRLVVFLGAAAVLFAIMAASAPGAGRIEGVHPAQLEDVDARAGSVAPTAEQVQRASELGASVYWNRFGTPQSLSKHGGFLATGVGGDSAVAAARNWLDANKALFRLSSTDGLELLADSRMPYSNGHAVHFRQTFGGVAAAHDGLVTVGLTGTPASGWNVAYASSSLTGDTALGGSRQLTPQEAWVRAAADVGRSVSLVNVRSAKTDRGWTVFGVSGFADVQRVRQAAVPTPTGGVRAAHEALVLDNRGGSLTGYRSFVDAENGNVLVRENLVHQSHPTVAPFTGNVPQVDGACAPDNGPWTLLPTESVRSVDVFVEATLTTNDSVIHLLRDGVIVASQDTVFSPEAIHYAPAGGVPPGVYTVRVCDFVDGAAWDTPNSYAGTIAFNEVAGGGTPYPPKWKVFPAYPTPPTLSGYPWNVSSTDIRKTWCWESVVQGNPVPGCEDEVQNLAARVPWDHDPNAGLPTFTTRGNAAISSESWFDPVAPGPTGHQPLDADRDYSFTWVNDWYARSCAPDNFVPGVGYDISAAVANLFAMHNRMHDWTYHLGFTEENWNAQQSNFGNAGAAGDPVLGQAQAGAANGGYPGYLGRDNANMRTLPDGVSSITNMYLWQPLKGAFYAPCVDGDYDMSVIGHEFGHMVENRMIGKGSNRSGHHAGAMGESNGDLMAMEVLNEYGFVPVSGENRYAVGAYATGSKERGIRNYGMNTSPLNFSNMGYDAFASPPVHADGEIWSATNFELRQALNAKYDGSHPSSDATLQRTCAEGKKAPEDCPGNRRWAQIMFDAYLLMPTAPTMLQARDAYLAADQMRFGGANQNELWLAFAHRGFGQGASASNAFVHSDTDPKPDFSSPVHSNATVTFAASATDEGNAPIATARIFVGDYEARTSPIADTNPSTNASGPNNNLDDVAQFGPGTYTFLVQAAGYGAVRLTRTFTAGQTTTVGIPMATNWASSAKGASASGDFSAAGAIVDDTEATNATASGVPVEGKQVTVDLAGTEPRTVARVQVSASLNAQNRFTALRQFRIEASTNGTTFTPVLTSAANAFPGGSPRPVLPQLLLRTFELPSPVQATHVRLVALTNQCTGQAEYQGEQDADPLNATDCRTNASDPPGSFAPRDNAVVVAELQVFGPAAPPPAAADLALTKDDSADPVQRGQQFDYIITVTNNGPSTAQGVTVTDELPKNAGYGSASSTQGTCGTKPSKRTVTCNVGTMTSGEVVTIRISVRPTDQTPITNTASVTAASPPDPNPSNNADTETTQVTS